MSGAAKCVHCGTYWAFTLSNADEFAWICRLCPSCIALTPRLAS